MPDPTRKEVEDQIWRDLPAYTPLRGPSRWADDKPHCMSPTVYAMEMANAIVTLREGFRKDKEKEEAE